jgi:hypothetical protein
MVACDLHVLGSAIGAGWEYRDPGRAPGELALSSLVSSAAMDPDRSVQGYREEARAAARSTAALDPFMARRLPARSRRYQLAAALIEEFCGGCAAPCANAPHPSYRRVGERRIGPGRRVDSRPGGRRLDDHLVHLEPAPA